MAATTRSSNRIRSAVALFAAAFGTTASAADAVGTSGDFKWIADVLTSDFRSDTLDLSGNVRVSQGPMSIEAGAATARDFRSENSRWQFEKAVHIQTSEAELQAAKASASIRSGQIAQARVEGSPAQFEQRGGRAQVRGRAGVIEYDFVAGIVKMTDQVWFSNGKDEFRGDVVIYNVRDERVQINPGGQSSGRVRGIIRPRQGTEVTPAPPTPQPKSGA